MRALAPVLAGESRPAWIGAPVFTVAAPDGGLPALAIYPVCTTPADQRCAASATGSTNPATGLVGGAAR